MSVEIILNRRTNHFTVFKYATRLYPDHVQTLAQKYLTSIFKKSKIVSHIGFLSNCVDVGYIPKGFRLKFTSTCVESDHEAILRNLRCCSLKLMKQILCDYRRKKCHLTEEISYFKSSLRQSTPLSSFNLIVSFAQKLNNHVYSLYKQNKIKKMPMQTTSKMTADDKNEKSVVTIPEDLPLSKAEMKLLQKGLKFSPTPNVDTFVVNQDFEAFFRRINIKSHFHNNQYANPDPKDGVAGILENIVREKSSWNPPKTEYPSLAHYIEEVKTLVNTKVSSKLRVKSNISIEESNAIKELKSRDDIVIKPADKGGATVVWRKDLYIEECMRQLSDQSYYIPLTEEPTIESQDIVTETISEMIRNGQLPREAINLISKKPRCPKFYCLPKIHKPNNPGRPIISSVNSTTELISSFLDTILQPILKSTPTYLKDTNDLLKKLAQFKFQGHGRYIVIMDVVALYTNIPHQDILTSIKYFLDQTPNTDIPTSVIIRLTELVLDLTEFEFNSMYFKQTKGVPMGTKMGPVVACLFMAYLEAQFNQTYHGATPDLDLRYIDDLLKLFSCSKDELHLYIQEFTTSHDSIKFEFKIYETSAPFLDVLIIPDQLSDTIQTTIYTKPTDSHTYVSYYSYHPKSTLNAIPYSQFLRLRRICSRIDEFENQAKIMSTHFINRHYPENLIKEAINKCRSISREELINKTNPRQNVTTERIPLVLNYSPLARVLAYDAIMLYKSIIPNSTGSQIIPLPPMKSFRRAPNLKQLLVRTSITKAPIPTTPGTFPCKRGKRCVTCKHTLKLSTVTNLKRTIHLKQEFTCESKSLIYAIKCNKCPDVIYIGQTERHLGDRFAEHRRDVLNKQYKNVSQHFNLTGHSVDDMLVTGLKYASRDEKVRIETENRMIHFFNSNALPGLNIKFTY